MQDYGLTHPMMDTKILILYVMSRLKYPVNRDEIYEICFQDEHLSYFDVCTAVPQMVETGHLAQEGDTFTVTDKGRDTAQLTERDLMFTLRQKLDGAADDFNRRVWRGGFVKTEQTEQENGEFSVCLTFSDQTGTLMKLELPAPDRRQAKRLCQRMEEKAELIYDLAMTALLDDEE